MTASPHTSRPKRERRAPGPNALARFVDETITARGLTLQEVADASGLAKATVSAIRLGRRGRRLSPTTVVRLARGLGVDPALIAEVAGRRVGTAEDQERVVLSLLRRLTAEDLDRVEGMFTVLARHGERGKVAR